MNFYRRDCFSLKILDHEMKSLSQVEIEGDRLGSYFLRLSWSFRRRPPRWACCSLSSRFTARALHTDFVTRGSPKNALLLHTRTRIRKIQTRVYTQSLNSAGQDVSLFLSSSPSLAASAFAGSFISMPHELRSNVLIAKKSRNKRFCFDILSQK